LNIIQQNYLADVVCTQNSFVSGVGRVVGGAMIQRAASRKSLKKEKKKLKITKNNLNKFK
jgi:hypothetical protein